LGVARAGEDGKWKFLAVLPLFDPPREDAKDNHRDGAQDGAVKIQDGDGRCARHTGEGTRQKLDMGTNIPRCRQSG